MIDLEIEEAILLALGVIAVSETFGRGVCARSAPPERRVSWVVVCALLAFALLLEVDSHQPVLVCHILFTMLASISVHIVHTLRGLPGAPSFSIANAGVLFGTAPWLVASLGPGYVDGVATYGLGLVFVLVPFLPVRWAWRTASRFLADRWPVREEVVGGSLWPFVRPRTVSLAFGIAMTGIALLDPGEAGRVAARGVGVLVAVALAYAVYRLAVRAGDPLREGRIWYSPRREGSFVLIDALAGAAIALVAITVACEAITTRQRMAADAALAFAAREALSQGMETTWGLSAEELAAAEGTVVTRLDHSARFLEGDLERTVLREEEGVLWRVRVRVRWKCASGADRSCTLESLRSAAGGRR